MNLVPAWPSIRVDRRELVRSCTKHFLESSLQGGVTWNHAFVSAVCRNLGFFGPLGQNRVVACSAKESRDIAEPEESVPIDSGGEFSRIDRLDGMVDAAVHNEPVHE